MSTRSKLLLTTLTLVLVVAAAVGAAFAARYAGGDDGFVIDRFEREVVVGDDASLEVTETIEVTFLEPRRGIFRDLEGQGPTDEAVRYTIHSVDQGEDGQPWAYAQERTEAGDPRVRIGDADVVLDPGPQTYRLRYSIDGLLFRPADRSDQVQVRLDIPGDQWPTDVATTELTVELPAEPTLVQCVGGTAGTTGECAEPSRDGTTVTQTIGELRQRETATVAVEFPAEALGSTGQALPEVDVTELEQRETFAALGVPLLPATLLLIVLIAAPALGLEWLRARRVYRDQVTDPHLHDRVTPTAELEPPDGLAPVELARVAQRLSADEALLATLVDLELRGVVTSTTSDDGERITIAPGPDPAAARPWEAEALQALCPGGDPITFDGEYDETSAKRSTAAQQALTTHAGKVLSTDSRYVHREGGWLRGGRFAFLVALVLAAGAVIGLLGGWLLDVPMTAVIVTWVGLGVAWIAISVVWRKERLPLTSEGRDVVERAGAFRHFLEEVHADRLEFAASQQTVGTTHPAVAMLPYAMALGLADSWLERFEPIAVEAARDGRAGVSERTDAWYLHHATFVAVAATHGSTTTAPSSSGGGGSFGGGGAGSGGGGGGGGSW